MAAFKVYALAILVACCAIQHATADWKNDLRNSHMRNVDMLVSQTLARISGKVREKGNTAAARQCLERASAALQGLKGSAWGAIYSCTTYPYESSARACARGAELRNSGRAQQIARDAESCINNS